MAQYPTEVTLHQTKYRVDPDGYTRRTLPAVRTAVDQGDKSGEQSISTEGLWRRSMRDWRGGAGQFAYDEETSVGNRFWSSVGINPWVEGKLSALQEMEQKATVTSVAVNAHCAAYNLGDSRLWFITGGKFSYTSANEFLSMSLTTTSFTTGDCRSSTSDGSTVWLVRGNGTGIDYTNNTNLATLTQFSNHAADMIAYAGGRLFIGDTNVLYEMNSSGNVATSGLMSYTHTRSDFRWSGAVTGPNGIYVWGYVGSTAEIYRVDFDAGTGGLKYPVLAMTLRQERVLCMVWTGTVAFVGTSRGFRCVTTSDTGLVYGPLVRFNAPLGLSPNTSNSVNAAVQDGKYVVFSWGPQGVGPDNLSIEAWGVGRADMSRFNQPLVPAYAAAECMPCAYNAWKVPSAIVMVYGWPYFLSGASYFADYTYPPGTGNTAWNPTAPTGTQTISIVGPEATRKLYNNAKLVTSYFTWGITDPKTVSLLQLTCDPLPAGEIQMDTSADTQTWYTVGYYNVPGGTGPAKAVLIPESLRIQSQKHSVKIVLKRGGTATQSGPTVRNFAVHAIPRPPAVEEIVVPLLISSQVESINGRVRAYDAYTEFTRLKALEAAGEIVNYTEGDHTAQVRIEQVAIQKPTFSGKDNWWEGTVNVRLITTAANNVTLETTYTDMGILVDDTAVTVDDIAATVDGILPADLVLTSAPVAGTSLSPRPASPQES